MAEVFYVVRQNAEGTFLLGAPNKVFIETDDISLAIAKFNEVAGETMVYPEDFKKGKYFLVSKGHYQLYPNALYVVSSNVYPCD